MAYNLDHQLAEVRRPDGTVIAFGYDAAGRVSTLTFPRVTLRLAITLPQAAWPRLPTQTVERYHTTATGAS